MGTKRDPSEHDGYEKAEPDEPIFTLMARDPLAPILVRLWADLRTQTGNNPDKIEESRLVAETMETWLAS